MRAKAVVVSSLLLNGALAIALWGVYRSSSRTARPGWDQALQSPFTNSTFRVAKTNVILNSRVFAWQNIESPDYDLYVLNLRGIGCPDTTVRDIIVADVNQLYARKRREMNTTTNDVKWWLSEPEAGELEAALARERALDQERRTLLNRLLGPDWEQSPEREPEPVLLAGPVLGALTPEQKQAVQETVSRSRRQVRDYAQECEDLGELPDPAQLARFREQTREELGDLLEPEQLQEFLLRYSNSAAQLRTELRGFEASPEEFRTLFAATDPIDRALQLLGNDDDPATAVEVARLRQQRDAAVRQALTPERYDAYRSLNDGDYRAALADARQAGATPVAGRGLYEINQAAVSERERISGDASLTAEEKARELKLVEQQQKAARAALLGLPIPEDTKGASSPANVFQHRAGPHDTLAALSLYYRIPISDLIRANPGMADGSIQPGSTVKIPEPGPLPWKPAVVPQR
jgi:hypothetical protein